MARYFTLYSRYMPMSSAFEGQKTSSLRFWTLHLESKKAVGSLQHFAICISDLAEDIKALNCGTEMSNERLALLLYADHRFDWTVRSTTATDTRYIAEVVYRMATYS